MTKKVLKNRRRLSSRLWMNQSRNSVEILLEKNVKKIKAIKGTVIVLTPNTGEILAMANYPSIDPVKCIEFGAELVKNPAVECIYEPGDAFEPFAKTACWRCPEIEAFSKTA